MTRSIETNRLQLKALTKEAAPMVLSFYEENKELFEPWEPRRSLNFYTLSYQKAFLTAEHNQIADGKLIRYWVFLKDCPEEIVGTVCFQNILKEPYHSCSLGYKFNHRYLHQGYATESIQKCLEAVFYDHFIHRVDAYIMSDNIASQHLIERLDFKYEGTCKAFARINGTWTDHKHYALINSADSTLGLVDL
ncbi:MAG: ribosomal-protein-alanine acetyltransferase [Firmicutes bacterium]|nr:ribosomal-protein-alanine acetyltransferase [Bacillota bacterium]